MHFTVYIHYSNNSIAETGMRLLPFYNIVIEYSDNDLTKTQA